MTQESSTTFKILSLGDTGTGKSCLINCYVDNTYDPSELSTLGIDFKVKTINYNKKQIILRIWDTAGQERFHNITQQYFRNADGILLMFDLSDRESFTKITYWIEQIKTYVHLESTPVLLIGTKNDIEELQVTDEEAKIFAFKNKMTYFSTSALKNHNLKETFECLTEKMLVIKSNHLLKNESMKSINLIKEDEDKKKAESLQKKKKQWC